MDRRRFVTLEDLDATGILPFGNPLLDAFTALLEDLIAPIFDEVYPELNRPVLSEIYQSGNDVVVFEISGSITLPVKKEVARDFSSIIVEFAGKKQQILNGLNWAITPTIKESLLEQYDLSAEQFLVRTLEAKVFPRLTASYRGAAAQRIPNYAGINCFSITVVLHLSIEDLSSIEPGGEEFVRLRYNNLCSTDSRYSEGELRSWAVELGTEGASEMSRDSLRQAIKAYYGLR